MAPRAVEMPAEGSWNPGMMVQEGEILALVACKDERKRAAVFVGEEGR